MPRRTTRSLPPRKISLRTSVEPTDDTEKLMSESFKNVEANPARSRPPSRPKLSQGSRPFPHHDYSVHEITDVPAPIPDTGQPAPSEDTITLVTPSDLASETSFASKATASRPHEPSKSTFVPLPSLITQNLTEIEEVAINAQSSASHQTQAIRPLATATTSSNLRNHAPQPNSPHLSATAIIALAVSGSLTLFVVVVLTKLLKRPRRRRTPTPSLPILHDGTFPNRVESEGSPIFGGKECSSPALQARHAKGHTGPWAWTQYNSGIPKPTPMVTVTRSSSQNINQTTQQSLAVVHNDTTGARGQSQGQYPFVGYGNPNAISKASGPVPLQPVQNAITRAVSRLSTASMSLYPNSPGGYSQVGADVGVAIDGVANNLAGDVAIRHKDRTMGSRNRISMIPPSNAKNTAALRRSQSFAYGGMEPTSPPTASAQRGRARIKSTYYTPGSYPRASAAPTSHGKRNLGHEQVEQNRVEGKESQQGRDLTLALGLTSPVPPSPQPTLYPDDSMSVIGEAKKVTLTGRSQKKPVPKASQCDSPPTDMTALGSLMMVDFAASKSTASLVNIRPCEAARARAGQGETVDSKLKRRVEDRPPRVPSPPPIPSLAQMAMEHGDPEGYAEYHSPTYSIYGLYDGERKSRALSYGGYAA